MNILCWGMMMLSASWCKFCPPSRVYYVQKSGNLWMKVLPLTCSQFCCGIYSPSLLLCLLSVYRLLVTLSYAMYSKAFPISFYFQVQKTFYQLKKSKNQESFAVLSISLIILVPDRNFIYVTHKNTCFMWLTMQSIWCVLDEYKTGPMTAIHSPVWDTDAGVRSSRFQVKGKGNRNTGELLGVLQVSLWEQVLC